MAKKHEIELNWKGGMAFEIEQEGGKLNIDAAEAVGGKGKGFLPKPLMLSAMAGCTAMDVASLMKKMRVADSVLDFKINIEAGLTEEHPKVYDDVTLAYTFVGKDMDHQKLEKSVTLSVERYCGVYEMFRSFAKVSHRIDFIDQ
jgi:putative redox protein